MLVYGISYSVLGFDSGAGCSCGIIGPSRVPERQVTFPYQVS